MDAATFNPPEPPPDPDERPANVAHPLPFDKRRKFTEADFNPFMDGKEWVPNFEPTTLDKVLPQIISGYGDIHHRRRVRVGRSPYGPSAIYFLDAGQGGGLTGEGVVLYSEGWESGMEKFKAATFAICKHEKTEEGHMPNHQRGWHPGHCKHCGLDMSVDSGD